jgi:hypothetical protein
MPLQLTGSISLDDVRDELGIPTQAPFSLTSASLGEYVPLNPFSFYMVFFV